MDIKARGDSAERKDRLIDFDDNLEVIGIQNDLVAVLASEAPTAEAYAKDNATVIQGRPAFLDLFNRLAGNLLAGKALSLEDLVDVLTLKDNRGRSIYDPVVALTRLFRDTVGSLVLCRMGTG